MPLESVYNPKEFEKDIYTKWVESGLGKPENQVTESSVYHSILMPPPNLTGDLHAGHAFQHYLSDTLCRHARLIGNKSLWYPGVDHAGLQLEGVVDKLIIGGALDDQIEKYSKNFSNDDFLILTQALKNKDRSQLPTLVKQNIPSMWLDFAWTKVNLWRNNQQEQAKVLGDTPDYSRQLFTLDDKANKMVSYAFREYWKDGLMYQGKYLINWSVGLQTALSDISGETDYLTKKDPFVTFLYKFSSYKSNSTLTYPIEELILYFTNNPFKVATVRPETIHGDMAIAIHPEIITNQLISNGFDKLVVSQIIEDIQSQDLILNVGIEPLGVKDVRLIISEKVEKDFGTGVLKITPASDIVDYEIWNEAYPNVPFLSAINKQGKLTNVCGVYENQDRDEARLNIIFDLAKNGFIPTKEGFAPVDLAKFEYDNYDKSVVELKEKLMVYEINFDYEHNVVICERSKTIVEPLISEEVFISMSKKTISTGLSLKEHGLEGFDQTNFYSNEYQKRGIQFLDGLNDWCISRNLVWGHQFPVWYNLESNPEKIFYSHVDWQNNKDIQNKIFIGEEEELHKFLDDSKLSASSWVQETRRLDTWFSSSLWPLSTFGFLDYMNGNNEGDFATFYPTSTMVTAKEIFNIWICRMVMLSKYFTSKLSKTDHLYNSIPFKDLVIHPTVLDDQGKKMSKSLGNGMDPVAQIDKFSSDSLRMAMLSGMIPDRNMRLGGSLADKLSEKYRNFGNKIWNIVRFMESKEAFNTPIDRSFEPSPSGWWLLSKFDEAVNEYNAGFKNYQLGSSLDSIYNFIWNDLASWHLEYLKVNDEDLVLTGYVIQTCIKLISPFMPFEAEVLWDKLNSKSIAFETIDLVELDYWFDQVKFRKESVKSFGKVVSTIESLRSIKGMFSIPAGSKLDYRTTQKAVIDNVEFIKMTTKCELSSSIEGEWYLAQDGLEVDILGIIPDKKSEIERTNKQITQTQTQIDSILKMLVNEMFLSRATPEAITSKHDDLSARKSELELLNNKLTILQK